MHVIELDAETEQQLARWAMRQSMNSNDLIKQALAEYLENLDDELENRLASDAELTYKAAR